MTAWRLVSGMAWLVLGALAIAYRQHAFVRARIAALGGVALVAIGLASIAIGIAGTS
ncbi:hypothetical protein [Motilibacter aurantiacus]|uniref:hypothetical protein n=1 Tax=Motilibacter aurantiacus TaxID=2714955 RepID=UPI00140B8182|nr:hypothetical protein [Motilibacter aurantiacus]NHC44254.1 hypothetical protein [Motilibacter aurantiacus]